MNAPFAAPSRSGPVLWDTAKNVVDVKSDECRLMILALPGFSLLSLSSFVDPLRLANSILGRSFFEWSLLSKDGQPVRCASGFGLSVDNDFKHANQLIMSGDRPTMVVVLAGEMVEKQVSASVINVLRLYRRHGVPIAALGTATWLLAEIGMLDGVPCTIHWDKRAAFAETFGRPQVTDRLFVRDSQLVTCAGEFASFDLVMEFISEHLGKDIAVAVCRHTTAGHWRSTSERQSAVGSNEGICKPVAEIIRIMEEHVEDPMPLRDIARCVGRSQRQIERLFARSLSISPMRYYLHVRLSRAKRLVEQTELPIVEVAIACGFASASHFSKCFRLAFGANPNAYRA
ncbi:GlxA family transcriptional regulator [Mesorhizobium sp.]|uniref:GlxA family transcriptional regulator n=1 Tax=Mesorhizobium sp. TaxID=1871066 RepID=UPI00120B947B|nr:GlxA family transcriptional regulator [Mesorhizobium sp.]TIN74118.1 MAG: GlxA family transcriptional regulator [Mesorhizobium sp.]TIO64646.1 MAG: GlxA family transcriptional regulator [Mesorhizobium sp.]TJV87976.1 MAG: GlxA family transcriptional regulator [Mesorhizobium sp.]